MSVRVWVCNNSGGAKVYVCALYVYICFSAYLSIHAHKYKRTQHTHAYIFAHTVLVLVKGTYSRPSNTCATVVLTLLHVQQVRDELRDDISQLHQCKLEEESALAEATEQVCRHAFVTMHHAPVCMHACM